MLHCLLEAVGRACRDNGVLHTAEVHLASKQKRAVDQLITLSSTPSKVKLHKSTRLCLSGTKSAPMLWCRKPSIVPGVHSIPLHLSTAHEDLSRFVGQFSHQLGQYFRRLTGQLRAEFRDLVSMGISEDSPTRNPSMHAAGNYLWRGPSFMSRMAGHEAPHIAPRQHETKMKKVGPGARNCLCSASVQYICLKGVVCV